MSLKIDHTATEAIRQQKLTGAAMGQYWKPVNLTKREYINPHKFGSGIKLVELASSSDLAAALTILLAAMPERRGGGDFQSNPFIGRWAGDKVVFVGDYSIDADMPSSPIPFSEVYHLTYGNDSPDGKHKAFTDVTDDVLEIMQSEGLIDPPAAEQPF
jgi:hypothetical protein